MRRSQYKSALSQIKNAAESAVEAGEEWDGPSLERRKIEFVDSLQSKNDAVEFRRQKRNERSELRRTANKSRMEKIKEEGIKNEWYFQSGDLVIVKGIIASKRAGAKNSWKPPAGTIGMIVDTVDTTSYNGTQTDGATIVVMVNGSIEQWNARWVKHCE